MDNLWKVIPVGSNWTEGRFITGYLNPITGDYVLTEAMRLLIHAANFPDVPHLLILDEMNLSHVEYYFSDFLSAMESHQPIILDNRKDDVPRAVPIGDNIIIVGTVNMDETTYSFSPKVLDRANVIEFPCAEVDSYLKSGLMNDVLSGDVRYLQDCMKSVPPKTKAPKALESMRMNTEETVDCIIRSLEEIQGELKTIGFPMGFRTLDEIIGFMYAAWMYEGEEGFKNNWKKYLDIQILQKVLPHIHGNIPKGNLEKLKNLLNGFNRSYNKLDSMIEHLNKNRIVTFNVR